MPLLDYPPYNIARRIPGVPEPVALWVAGPASGVKAWDSSVRGSNYGTLNSGVILASYGSRVFSQSWKFDGLTGSIPLANTITGSPSIALWALIDASATGAIQHIICNDNGLTSSTRIWQFRLDSTGILRTIFFMAGNTNGQAASAAVVTGAGPTLVVATWDGATIRNYINGKPDGTGVLSGTITNVPTVGVTLGNGAGQAGSGPLNGRLIAAGVGPFLSASQVSVLYRRLRFGVQPRKQVYLYASGGSAFRFRRTLSPLGTRIGSRQVIG